MTTSRNPAFRVILWGGLLGGLGDFLFAFFYYGWKIRVFQSVAAGLIGRTAFEGGVPTFLLGVVLHFLIALIWAGLFWLLARAAPVLLRHTVPAGLLYGCLIYYGMNCVVLPLSALHTKPWTLPPPTWPLAAHAVLVGLPIALAARKLLGRAA